ncbi:MAG TPA: proton-conducting transporter membrane subunit [bacterium]|nr:proton-conducting transporter membrane subunit [bacterium]HNT65475.1 proton-conducting transporter membrane subunit [bacterium]
MEPSALLTFLFLPAAVAVINLFLPVRAAKALTLLTLLYLLYCAITLWPSASPGSSSVYLGVDRLAAFVLLFAQILSTVILLFSLKGVRRDIERFFFVLFPLTVAFCNGVLLSRHALLFLIFWGLSGVSLYLFALLGKDAEASAAAKKTFIIIGGSDVFLILGLVLLIGSRPVDLWWLDKLNLRPEAPLYWLAFVSLLIASLAKAGGFPLHTWVPDFSKSSPIESVALLPASLDKLLGIFLLARMMTSLFVVGLTVKMIVVSIGAFTIISAVMMALSQHNGRRMLGYHAVSQVGYMIMGVGSGNPLAFAGGLFHMINHTIYKSNLFLSLGSVEKQTGSSEFDDLGGLAKSMPLTFIMALVGALAISGIPPFNGFFSKWMIYQGLLETAKTLPVGYQLWMLICLILAIFGSALTLASFVKFLHAVFLGRNPGTHKVREAPINQWLATGILAFLCAIFGLFAVALPLKKLIVPVMVDLGMPEAMQFIGFFHPLLLLGLFAVVFGLGILLYFLVRTVRYDDVYLGGQPADPRFRITGSDFYREVREMPVLNKIFAAADKKYCDVYEMGSKGTFAFSGWLQKLHPGLLPLYILYIFLGLLILGLVINIGG